MTRFAFDLLFESVTFTGLAACIAWIGVRDFYDGVALLVTVWLLLVAQGALERLKPIKEKA